MPKAHESRSDEKVNVVLCIHHLMYLLLLNLYQQYKRFLSYSLASRITATDFLVLHLRTLLFFFFKMNLSKLKFKPQQFINSLCHLYDDYSLHARAVLVSCYRRTTLLTQTFSVLRFFLAVYLQALHNGKIIHCLPNLAAFSQK